FYRWKNRVELPPHELLDLHGRNIVLTGGTSGIGRALAGALVSRGANVIVGSRDMSRGQALCVALTKDDRKLACGSVRAFHLDLEDASSISDFVAEVKESVAGTGGVHAFVNAAAEIKSEFVRGATGLDATFTINHLGPQQLVSALAPELRRAASAERHARVVLVGSRLERRGVVDLASLQKNGLPDPRMLEKFEPMTNYGSSKLANMLLCKELSARFGASHVDVSIVSPGMVNTELWRNFPAWYRMLTYPVRATFLRSPQQGAEGILYAIAAREIEGVSGGYMCDGKMIESSETAQDAEKAAALFLICSKVIEQAKVVYFAKRLGIDLPPGALS
ncbi:unnamed protein product, partial [Polarella glacialis]